MEMDESFDEELAHARALLAGALAHDRDRLNLTQQEIADKLGVGQQSWSKWESGINLPRGYRLKQLSAFFGEGSPTAQAVEKIQPLVAPRVRHLGSFRIDPERARRLITQLNEGGVPSFRNPANDTGTAMSRALNLLTTLPENVRGKYATDVLEAVAAVHAANSRMDLVLSQLRFEQEKLLQKDQNTDG